MADLVNEGIEKMIFIAQKMLGVCDAVGLDHATLSYMQV